MKKLAKILVIAGSDSGGGAGIQADIKAIAAQGAYASTAITSVTAQNTLGVQAIYDIPLEMIQKQIASVLDDIGADFIKTGMLSSKEIIDLVARAVNKYHIDLVLDPVMVAKGGAKLLRDDAVEELKTKLIPKAYLVTPNILEAEIIAGMKIDNESDMEAAAHKILTDYGCSAVLIKGGHLQADDIVDILLYRLPHSVNKAEFKMMKIRAKRIHTNNTHGTGCTYASAIAARLAKGESIELAVKNAHSYLQHAISKSEPIGKGHSPVNHFWFIKNTRGSEIFRTIMQSFFYLLALLGMIIPTIKYLTKG